MRGGRERLHHRVMDEGHAVNRLQLRACRPGQRRLGVTRAVGLAGLVVGAQLVLRGKDRGG